MHISKISMEIKHLVWRLCCLLVASEYDAEILQAFLIVQQ